MSGFEVSGHSFEKNPLKINFEPNHMNAELPILGDGLNYTIKGRTVKCGSESFEIPELNFYGKPPVVRDHP